MSRPSLLIDGSEIESESKRDGWEIRNAARVIAR